MRIYKKINTGVEICNETLCYELTKRHFFRVWKTEHLRAQWLSLTCMKCICTHRDAVTVSYSISCRVNKGAESLFYCVHSHCHSCIHTHRRMRAHTHTHTHTHTHGTLQVCCYGRLHSKQSELGSGTNIWVYREQSASARTYCSFIQPTSRWSIQTQQDR